MKRITISSGDYGISFEIQILDNDDNPVVIADTDTVAVNIVDPNNVVKTIDSTTGDVQITDRANGIILFKLEAEDTDTIGDYSVYVEIDGSSYEVSAVKAIVYSVVEKNGGA